MLEGSEDLRVFVKLRVKADFVICEKHNKQTAYDAQASHCELYFDRKSDGLSVRSLAEEVGYNGTRSLNERPLLIQDKTGIVISGLL